MMIGKIVKHLRKPGVFLILDKVNSKYGKDEFMDQYLCLEVGSNKGYDRIEFIAPHDLYFPNYIVKEIREQYIEKYQPENKLTPYEQWQLEKYGNYIAETELQEDFEPINKP